MHTIFATELTIEHYERLKDAERLSFDQIDPTQSCELVLEHFHNRASRVSVLTYEGGMIESTRNYRNFWQSWVKFIPDSLVNYHDHPSGLLNARLVFGSDNLLIETYPDFAVIPLESREERLSIVSGFLRIVDNPFTVEAVTQAELGISDLE